MIDVDVVSGTPIARVRGDIDMSNIVQIESEVGRHVRSEAFGFVLDLSDVAYLDSAGIRLIYQLDDRARARQQTLVLVIPTGSHINRTLEAAGVIGTVRIVTSAAQALDVLGTT